MSKIILCRGIQGSGKTTWAKKWVSEDTEHRIRINNDDIRNMLGPYWIPSRENLVGIIKIEAGKHVAAAGYDIVVDNMNLSDSEVSKWQEIALEHGYRMEFKDFFIPLETCIERDSKRDNPVGKEIITITYNRHSDLLKSEI